MSKRILFITIATLTFGVLSFLPLRSYAQENSASDSADQIQENIKQRIQKTVEENSAKIKGLTTGSNRKAVWGKIQRISENSLNLDTLHGTQIITIDEHVKLHQNGKEIELKDVEIEHEAVVYGTQDKEDFIPEKIEISKSTLLPAEKVISVGNIQKIDKTTITIQPRGKDEQEVYEFQKSSQYQQLNGEKITLSDVEDGLDVIIIATSNTSTRKAKDSRGGVVVLRALTEIEK